MIDRKRESLELLWDFMAAIPEAEVHVVRNLYLGSEKKFELYNGSKIKSAIEAKGSKSLSFPELADRVTDAMNKGRMTIEKATGELSLRRSDGARKVAGGMRRDAVAGRRWVSWTNCSLSSSPVSRRTMSGSGSIGFAMR